ncbi:MAG: DNA internalization-related competence protein ComEC/Rec2 [Bradymonadales bacterium]|nr:DNA internalization-related competence protein ComEC/Rec2 [Bradymonadales bacterium]
MGAHRQQPASYGMPRWPYSVHLALGTVAGIRLASWLPGICQVGVAVLGLGLVLLATLMLAWSKGARGLVCWFLFGMGAGGMRLAFTDPRFLADEEITWQLPEWPARVEMELIARAVSGARRTDSGWQAVVEVREIRARGSQWEPACGRLRLIWRSTRGEVLTGDILQIKGHGGRAPPRQHPFDRDRRHRERREGVAGTVTMGGGLHPLLIGRSSSPVHRFFAGVDRLRLTMEQALIDCADPRVTSWILAVGVGTRADFDPSDRELVIRSGIAHLLAVSGLHLGIFVLTVRRVVQWVAGLLVWPLTIRHRRFHGALVTLPLCWLYTLLTGVATATTRAALFVSFYSLAELLGRRSSGAGAVGISCAVILLYNPHELFSPSFQLSVMAVIGLLLGGSAGRRRTLAGGVELWRRLLWRFADRVRGLALLSLGAWMGTAPVLAYHFGQISISGILANILVVPLLSVALVAGSGAALAMAPLWPGVAAIVAGGCQVAIDTAFCFLEPASNWVGDPLTIGRPWVPELVAWYLLALSGVAGSARRVHLWPALRLGCGSLVVMAVCCCLRLSPPPVMEVWFLPVGQGDATLVRLPSGHHLLVDAGGQRVGADPGRSVIVPILRGLGVQRLDLLVLSHGDFDHIGGVAGVIGAYPPRELWLTRSVLDQLEDLEIAPYLREGGTVIRVMEGSGAVYPLGGARLEVFQAGVMGSGASAVGMSGNNRSLCLKISWEDRRVLLPGDVEEAAEALLVGQHGLDLESDLLKVPHHGSRSSSSMRFLAHVLPRFAVFSLGAGNRFGFPHGEVTRRYERLGVRSWRTDREGLVRFRLSRFRIAVRAGNW